MVHLPQSEPSIQYSAADNKGDEHSLIMALMVPQEGCVLWGDISGSEIISLELFNLSPIMTCTITV